MIAASDKPWLTLFSGPDLDAVAEALAAQPQADASSVYASLDGKPRSLTEAEVLELSQHLARLGAGRQPET